MSDDAQTPLAFELYRDAADEWRWRARNRWSDSDRIIADSGEGYPTRADARQAIQQLRSYTPDAPVHDISGAASGIQFRHDISVEMQADASGDD